MRGTIATPDKVAQIRAYAARGMSAGDAASEIGTTRSAVLGIALRNGFKFNGKPSQGVRTKKPVSRAAAFVLAPAAPKARAPGLTCQWVGCTRDAELGDMFCHGHGKRQLMVG